MKKVTILVPCFNEEKSLPLFYFELNSELGGEIFLCMIGKYSLSMMAARMIR